MKISVSLPESDVEFLDEQAVRAGYPSRSAALHAAVRMMRESALLDSYADAWSDETYLAESALWDTTAGDGISQEDPSAFTGKAPSGASRAS